MSSLRLEDQLKSLGQPRVLVVGDLILDRYISGEVRRISPEAPIPVLAAETSEHRLGGAGNVAVNLASMEARVHVVGVVGDDRPGGMMAWGIPAFRLPTGVIDEDMDRLRARCPGLHIHTNTALGRDVSLPELK